MRKIILSLCLLLVVLCNSAYAFSGGTGTIGDPWQIANIYDLQDIDDNATTRAGHYIQTADIDGTATHTWNLYSGYYQGFNSIGEVGRDFTGTYNGQGYNITNVKIYRPPGSPLGTHLLGIFRATNGAEISNLTIVDFYAGGENFVAALVGRTFGSTVIHNVNVVNVSIDADLFAGSITGQLGIGTGGEVYKCSSIGGVIDSGDYTGGLIGEVYLSAYLHDSYTTTEVNGNDNVGGAVGAVQGTSNNVYDCWSSGQVTGNTALVGGFAGRSNAGGVIRSYYNSDTSLQSDTGKGEPRTTAEMQTQSTFTNWDFADTWRMSGYPILYHQISDEFYLYPGNETISRTAPPLLHSVTVDMFRKGAISYDITIATDDLYTNVVYSANKLSSGGLANLTQTVSLEARTYYMQVEALDGSGNTLDTATSTFTISQTIDLGSTSVAGNIYEIISGVNTPISNVKVTLYNDTVSYDYITSSNGYYQFTGLANSTTYNMVAVKNGYEDSTLNVFTSVNGSTVTKNILMQKEQAPNYIMPHYVRFTVRSLLGGVYEGVLVTVYEGNSATPLFTQTTGSDGAVGFELSENIRYRLTLYSESDNINTVYQVTPTKSEYNIYVSLTGSSHQTDAGLILYGMHIDGNQLNVTWQDTSGLTSLVEVTIKNRDDSIAYYLNSTDSEGFLLQDVNTTENLTYIVELKIQTAGLDETFIRTHILTFESGVRPAFNLGFSASWQSAFLASLSLIFLAVIFGSGNAHVGAILVSLGGLFHIFVTGWIPASVLTVAMAFIAVIVSVVFYMRKGEDVR